MATLCDWGGKSENRSGRLPRFHLLRAFLLIGCHCAAKTEASSGVQWYVKVCVNHACFSLSPLYWFLNEVSKKINSNQQIGGSVPQCQILDLATINFAPCHNCSVCLCFTVTAGRQIESWDTCSYFSWCCKEESGEIRLLWVWLT